MFIADKAQCEWECECECRRCDGVTTTFALFF